MPRKAKPQLTPLVGDTAEDQPIYDRETDDIIAFFSSIGGSAVFCRIEKYLKSGESGQCETIGFDEIRDDPAEYLRQHWGAGRYKLALLNERKQWVTSKNMNVEARPGSPGPGGAPGLVPDQSMNFQISMMREQMAMYQTMITTLMAQMKGPDIGALLQGIGAISKPSDPVAMLASLISAFQAVRPSEVDPMARARELIGLAKELTPAPPGSADPAPAGWLDVVKDVGFRVLDRIGPGGAPPPQAALPAGSVSYQAAPALPQSQPAPANGAGGPRTMEDFYKSVRDGIVFLRTKAALKRAPEFWVDYLFEESQDLRFNAIIHAVQSGYTVENLFELAPEISADPVESQWFKDLYVGIKRSLEGFPTSPGGNSAGENLGSPGAGGNGANAGNHGDGGVVGPPNSSGAGPG